MDFGSCFFGVGQKNDIVASAERFADIHCTVANNDYEIAGIKITTVLDDGVAVFADITARIVIVGFEREVQTVSKSFLYRKQLGNISLLIQWLAFIK